MSAAGRFRCSCYVLRTWIVRIIQSATCAGSIGLTRSHTFLGAHRDDGMGPHRRTGSDDHQLHQTEALAVAAMLRQAEGKDTARIWLVQL